MSNNDIATRLQEQAKQLRRQHDNLYRVKAYRQAAEALMRLEAPAEDLYNEHGRHALEEVPGIGKRLAKRIAHYLQTGEWADRR